MHDAPNPYLALALSPPPPAPPSMSHEEVVRAPLTGPRAPQPGVVGVDTVDRLPLRRVSASPVLWWVGAHGGAGETTLAQLFPGTRAARHGWPVLDRAPDNHPPPAVVLLARTHLRGLLAAQRAAVEWASGTVPEVDLRGLVLLADAPGRLPHVLGDLADLIAGGVPRVWRVPWIERWRTGDLGGARSLPRSLRSLSKELSAVSHSPDRPHRKDT